MSNFLLYKKSHDIQIEKILEEMSKIGIKVESAILYEVDEVVAQEITKVTHKIFELTGNELNLNSPQQVAKLLFEDLGLPSSKKLKSGFSTDEKVLNQIKKLHPIVPLLLEYRTLSKLRSTYLTRLCDNIQEDGRVHSTFMVDIAKTGRVVSRDPNLQNIPIRGAWGKPIRKAFVAAAGFSFLAVDYSQIELRLLAHLSLEPKMVEILSQNGDIHVSTAVEIFNKPKSEISEDERRIAKTVNFSVIYGISAHGLAETLEIDTKQAAYFIKTYFDKYPQVKNYFDEERQKAYQQGFVETLGGSKRDIPELTSSNHFVRKSGERMALNYPIQGSAAEIIKLAMISIDNRIKSQNLRSRMLLQIHDELLFEVLESEMESMSKMVKEEMESVVSLKVPLKVNMKLGQNWGEL